MNKSLPQVLGARLTALVCLRDLVGAPVVLNDFRVVYRDVGGALVELRHRIATFVHYLLHQLIGFRCGVFGFVNEALLNCPPLFLNRSAISLGSVFRSKLETRFFRSSSSFWAFPRS